MANKTHDKASRTWANTHVLHKCSKTIIKINRRDWSSNRLNFLRGLPIFRHFSKWIEHHYFCLHLKHFPLEYRLVLLQIATLRFRLVISAINVAPELNSIWDPSVWVPHNFWLHGFDHRFSNVFLWSNYDDCEFFGTSIHSSMATCR